MMNPRFFCPDGLLPDSDMPLPVSKGAYDIRLKDNDSTLPVIDPVTGNEVQTEKDGGGAPLLPLVENPDILASVAQSPKRPRLVVGFAAETNDLIRHAQEKLARKGCDLIVANDVSEGSGVFGGATNEAHLVSREGVESWPRLSKQDVAERLVARLAHMFHGEAVS